MAMWYGLLWRTESECVRQCPVMVRIRRRCDGNPANTMNLVTTICVSRQHCTVCRQRSAGRKWRESVVRIATLSVAECDWPCPLGLEWNPSAERLREFCGVASTMTLSGPDYTICDSCDHQHWPSGAARGCKLIDDGQPCSLGARLRVGGPWPPNCPRNRS